jgi:methyl-accepting chemotaxis protein
VRRSWPLARSIAAGYAAVVALTLVLAVVALVGLQSVTSKKDHVIDVDAGVVLDVQKLVSIRDARAAANRAFLISGQQSYLDLQHDNERWFGEQVARIRRHADTPRTEQLLDEVVRLQNRFVQLDLAPVQLKQQGAGMATVASAWEAIEPQRRASTDSVNTLSAYQQSLVDSRKREAGRAAAQDKRIIVALLILSVLAAAVLAVLHTRRLKQRIGSAVGRVQNSSEELSATAAEQVGGAGQQATTVGELSTTTTELLASSRQIAKSAERVAETAEATAEAGLDGRATVARAGASMADIRGQVDRIVDHMRELGERAQQIGAVLDIVAELSEQTNILALNATIEAVGAGEAGRRFAVVADEIRKLADRVAGSTHEVRDLVELVRTSVHRTVMATELGAKAVESGTIEVANVTSAFEHIVGLVQTTTEAAREIELSTQQQTVAVEQVNVAIADLARTTRRTETGANRTADTATQLKELSAALREMVERTGRPDVAGPVRHR